MAQTLVPLENFSSTISYRRQDNGQKDYRSIKIEGRMIEIRDHMGPVVWLLPPNFLICKIDTVPDEEEDVVVLEETIELEGDNESKG